MERKTPTHQSHDKKSDIPRLEDTIFKKEDALKLLRSGSKETHATKQRDTEKEMYIASPTENTRKRRRSTIMSSTLNAPPRRRQPHTIKKHGTVVSSARYGFNVNASDQRARQVREEISLPKAKEHDEIQQHERNVGRITNEKVENPKRRAFLKKTLYFGGGFATGLLGGYKTLETLSRKKEHEKREKREASHPIEWYIENGKIPTAEDGPRLAQAAYERQLHHLLSYDERNEADDFKAAVYRIAAAQPERIAATFAERGFSMKVAFGLPIQESFFRTGIRSRSDALGPYQIKERTARAIIHQDPDLEDYAALSRATLRKELLNNPLLSAKISAAILAAEKEAYQDEKLALTAYNTGRSLGGVREELIKRKLPFTYENFTKIIAERIANVMQQEYAHGFYTIKRGDTFTHLHRIFPQYSKEKLLEMVGGSVNLIAGAQTKIPLSQHMIAKRIKEKVKKDIEMLEYAAKVRAAGDALDYTPLFQVAREFAEESGINIALN